MDDELTLRLSSQKMDIIANALGQRPYIEVAQLLQDIGQQIKAQQEPQALPHAANGAAGEAEVLQ
jgi:hypothetical protein